MAKKDEAKKVPATDDDMPEGFVALGRKNVDGWFTRRAGNKIQGILKDAFTVKSRDKRFPDKKVYVIEITQGSTVVSDAEGNPQELTEGTVGLDETGYLKKLGDLDVGAGREVWIKCKGKESDAKDAPWIFVTAVVPF